MTPSEVRSALRQLAREHCPLRLPSGSSSTSAQLRTWLTLHQVPIPAELNGNHAPIPQEYL